MSERNAINVHSNTRCLVWIPVYGARWILDFDVLSSLRLIIYLKLGVFVSRILSGTTQYYNPCTVHGNIELNRSFLCNCFLFSREGSSITEHLLTYTISLRGVWGKFTEELAELHV